MKDKLKIVLLFIPFVFCVNCKKSSQNLPAEEILAKDLTVTKDESLIEKNDTVVKTNKLFKVNGIECYWKLLITTNSEIIRELRGVKTNKILLSNSDYSKEDEDYNAENYFNDINKNGFVDLNFDNFKDFAIKSYGSKPTTDLTNIYIYNPKTGVFTHSEELSNNNIEIRDSINKVLITADYDIEGNTIYKKHFFDKKGNIIATKIEIDSIN